MVQSDAVRFEESEDGGVELVFDDELLEVIGVGAGDEVEVRTVVVDSTDVQFEIDFGVDLTEDQIDEVEDVLGESMRVAEDG